MDSTQKANEGELQAEREYFEANRSDFTERYRDLCLLIKGSELIGAFPDAESAYKEGLAKFGLQPFLVKKVLKEEPISTIPVFSVSVPRAGL